MRPLFLGTHSKQTRILFPFTQLCYFFSGSTSHFEHFAFHTHTAMLPPHPASPFFLLRSFSDYFHTHRTHCQFAVVFILPGIQSSIPIMCIAPTYTLQSDKVYGLYLVPEFSNLMRCYVMGFGLRFAYQCAYKKVQGKSTPTQWGEPFGRNINNVNSI